MARKGQKCVFSGVIVADSVGCLVNAMSTNWILLQFRIPILAGKTSERMGAGFDVTIIQESSALAALCKISCSSLTVIKAKSSDLLHMLANNKTIHWKEYSMSNGVNTNINAVPINNPSFNIVGIDITFKLMISPLFAQPLHTELQQILRIIKHLATSRVLKYFVILCTTTSSVELKNMNLHAIKCQTILFAKIEKSN